MKKNEETLKASMDRRLSFLDDLPSCRAAVQYRIAQEEEPVMKRKFSVGLVFALILVVLSVAAVAAGLLLSPKADAVRIADKALEERYGISAEMQTFFSREEEELEGGAVKVSYTGAGAYRVALGTYTVLVKDGTAEASWSYDGKDVSGGYESDVWGTEQLKQMLADSADETRKAAFIGRAAAIAEAHGVREDEDASNEASFDIEKYEAGKTAAMNARKLSEDEMIAAAREFIVSNYGLNEEQQARLDLYTNSFEAEANTWYEMVDGKPCFEVRYLLYEEYTTEQMDNDEPMGRTEKDGYYQVFVNVETGVIEQFTYDSALGGEG